MRKSEHLAAMQLQTTMLLCRSCLLAVITVKEKPQLLFREKQNKVKSNQDAYIDATNDVGLHHTNLSNQQSFMPATKRTCKMTIVAEKKHG